MTTAVESAAAMLLELARAHAMAEWRSLGAASRAVRMIGMGGAEDRRGMRWRACLSARERALGDALAEAGGWEWEPDPLEPDFARAEAGR